MYDHVYDAPHPEIRKNNFKTYSAFELGDSNRKSDKCIRPRIEFCVECVFRIFGFLIFEKIYWKAECFFRRIRSRGRRARSRRVARRDRDRTHYAGSRIWRARSYRRHIWPAWRRAAAPAMFLWSQILLGSISIAMEVQGGD